MNDIVKNEPCGVLLVNKHKGVTSHDIVNKIRRLFCTKKVGHTGTLDPMATGVLVILVGRAAKASEYLVSHSKKYRALLKLGLATDSEDITGSIISKSDDIPCETRVIDICKGFVGEIMQTPPMYSALKVGGKKLVDLAREGITVERKSRPITVHQLDVKKTEKADEYILDVHCSSGTYIRTLCADIGQALGCGGVMAELERIQTGNFDIENSYTIDDIQALDFEQRLSLLIPTESLFSELAVIRLEPFYERLSRNGCEIYQKKIRTSFSIGERVRICDKNGIFYALGEVREYEDGSAVKAIKFFDI